MITKAATHTAIRTSGGGGLRSTALLAGFWLATAALGRLWVYKGVGQQVLVSGQGSSEEEDRPDQLLRINGVAASFWALVSPAVSCIEFLRAALLDQVSDLITYSVSPNIGRYGLLYRYMERRSLRRSLRSQMLKAPEKEKSLHIVVSTIEGGKGEGVNWCYVDWKRVAEQIETYVVMRLKDTKAFVAKLERDDQEFSEAPDEGAPPTYFFEHAMLEDARPSYQNALVVRAKWQKRLDDAASFSEELRSCFYLPQLMEDPLLGEGFCHIAAVWPRQESLRTRLEVEITPFQRIELAIKLLSTYAKTLDGFFVHGALSLSTVKVVHQEGEEALLFPLRSDAQNLQSAQKIFYRASQRKESSLGEEEERLSWGETFELLLPALRYAGIWTLPLRVAYYVLFSFALIGEALWKRLRSQKKRLEAQREAQEIAKLWLQHQRRHELFSLLSLLLKLLGNYGASAQELEQAMKQQTSRVGRPVQKALLGIHSMDVVKTFQSHLFSLIDLDEEPLFYEDQPLKEKLLKLAEKLEEASKRCSSKDMG